MKLSPQFSIVIAAHNRSEYLKTCLYALTRLACELSEFEVIVVNDGSTDNTREILDSYRAPYQLRALHSENRGLAAARNQGIEHAAGEICILLDNDCLLSPNCITHLRGAVKADPSAIYLSSIRHIQVGHVPELFERARRNEPIFPIDPQILVHLDEESELQVLLRRIKDRLPDLVTGWVGAQGPSVCMATNQIKALGGYDAAIRSYGMEDFDFAFRGVLSGRQIIHMPESVIYHMDHGHPKKQFFADTTRTAQQFYRKHQHRPEARTFLKFLLGHINFEEFNNHVARARSMPPIDDLELRRKFSIYVMVKQRGHQLDQQKRNELERQAPSGDRFFKNLLESWIRQKMSSDSADRHTIIGQIEAKRVAVIAPHPDDEVIGCGGMMQRMRQGNAHVDVIFVTAGSGAPPSAGEGAQRELRAGRRAESARAAEILGAHAVVQLDLPERRITRHLDSDLLRDTLEHGCYEAVFTVGPNEFHPDHRAVWKWAQRSVAELSYRPEIYLYEVWGSCAPNCLLPLSEQEWMTKVRALEVYRTQMQQADYLHFTELLASERGRLIPGANRSTRAEAFHRVVYGMQ